MGSRCPNEASRVEDRVTMKNVTFWQRSGDGSAVAGAFCNSIRYKAAFLFPESFTTLQLLVERSGRFTSKSFIHFISLSHSVGNNWNVTTRDRFLWGRVPGCTVQQSLPWNPFSFSQRMLKRRKSSSGLCQPPMDAAGRARLCTPVKHLQFLPEFFLIYNFL